MSDSDMAWARFVEGSRLRWPFSFSSADLKTFSNLSGDFNPIHVDPQFAKSKGFNAPLIYGLLLSTQISRLIGQEMPDSNCILTRIQMNFVAPAFVDDDLEFIAHLVMKSDATYSLEFKCQIIRGQKVLSQGSVSALWRP